MAIIKLFTALNSQYDMQSFASETLLHSPPFSMHFDVICVTPPRFSKATISTIG